MFIARRSVQAVVVLLAASLGSLPALSQSTQFLSLEARALRVSPLSSAANPCSSDSNYSLPALHRDISEPDKALAPCDRPVYSPMPGPSGVTPVSPCALNPATQGCDPTRDFVRDDLNTMGKQGQSILRARDRVLEILQSENTCSAWYRTKVSNPAEVFRTLTFTVDRNGEIYVRRMPEPDGTELIRNPYVARVLQGEGSSSTVTINANGAFFIPMANAVSDRGEGGPLNLRGVRPIQVGPYAGGTFRAQVLVLLHEFGHVIDLLPQDHGDPEGRSRQNTAEVLQACRAQVESKETPHSFLASR